MAYPVPTDGEARCGLQVLSIGNVRPNDLHAWYIVFDYLVTTLLIATFFYVNKLTVGTASHGSHLMGPHPCTPWDPTFFYTYKLAGTALTHRHRSRTLSTPSMPSSH
jgi:hypothetical protein